VAYFKSVSIFRDRHEACAINWRSAAGEEDEEISGKQKLHRKGDHDEKIFSLNGGTMMNHFTRRTTDILQSENKQKEKTMETLMKKVLVNKTRTMQSAKKAITLVASVIAVFSGEARAVVNGTPAKSNYGVVQISSARF
jgi:hypothetical protein